MPGLAHRATLETCRNRNGGAAAWSGWSGNALAPIEPQIDLRVSQFHAGCERWADVEPLRSILSTRPDADPGLDLCFAYGRNWPHHPGLSVEKACCFATCGPACLGIAIERETERQGLRIKSSRCENRPAVLGIWRQPSFHGEADR